MSLEALSWGWSWLRTIFVRRSLTEGWRCICRYFAPERDMQLARELYAEPFTYADFLKTSGYTGTQDIEEGRRKLDT